MPLSLILLLTSTSAVHFSEESLSQDSLPPIHVIVPGLLPRVAEAMEGTVTQSIDRGTLPAARALLSLGLKRTTARQAKQGESVS
jgi:hypothetical protein